MRERRDRNAILLTFYERDNIEKCCRCVPLSVIDRTVCLHTFSLLGNLHACYGNEEKRVKMGTGLIKSEQGVKSAISQLTCARKMFKRLINQLSGFIIF